MGEPPDKAVPCVSALCAAPSGVQADGDVSGYTVYGLPWRGLACDFPFEGLALGCGGVASMRRSTSSGFGGAGRLMVDHPITLQEQAEANQFYQEVGRTIGRWSNLEYFLSHMFRHVTQMEEVVARHIFHSARSWRGRYDMLAGALSASESAPGVVSAYTAILERANQYSAFRNILAHDQIQLSPPEIDGTRRLVIRPPKANLSDPAPLAINRQHIRWAGEHINRLSATVVQAVRWDGEDQLGSPERLRWLLDQLPIQPHLSEPDQKSGAQFWLGLQQQPYPN